MSQETELKLVLPRSALAALRRHPLVQAAAKSSPTHTLDNTYYDTSALALRQHGIAVRTRRQGRRWLQTVKCAGRATAGLSSRPEWEQPFAGSFDFSAIDEVAVHKVLTTLAPDLNPVFSTRFRRETRQHRGDNGVLILMMIDTGEVVCGEHHDPLCELELELVSGTPRDLLVLASRLADDLPLLPSDISKAERGFRLLGGQAIEPVRAEPSPVSARQSPVSAFVALASGCVRQWQANAMGAMDHADPEFIHQLRVSQRRLRSLLRLFAPTLPDAFVSIWNAQLRSNAAGFGDTRDLDVLSSDILAPVVATTPDEEAALTQLRALVSSARDDARRLALARLDPAEQGRLIIRFMTDLHALPENTLHRAVSLHAFARLQLNRLRKRVRKRFVAAHSLIPAELHALRIAVKQWRYGIEFFAPLLHPRSMTAFGQSLAKAQNALGFINDLDVARKQLACLAGEDLQLAQAASFCCGWHGPGYAKARRRAMRKLHPLLNNPSRWRKLTAKPSSQRHRSSAN